MALATDRFLPWGEAMAEALYGERGFYRLQRPHEHFSTSVSAGPLFAEAIAELASRVAALLPDGPLTLVDVGAGDGQLLRGLADALPGRCQLTGVELRARPSSLPARVGWRAELPPRVRGLVVANEWLDNIPVDRALRTADGWRQVLVDQRGEERLGGPLDLAGRQWADAWCGAAQPGEQVEIGVRRDRAWADLVSRLDEGFALCVDYAAHGIAPTLTGYRRGQQVAPVPDGSCDLTAHVRLDAVRAAAVAAGAERGLLTTQRLALGELGLHARRPGLELAAAAPATYVVQLQRAGQAAELLDPEGLGRFGWLLQGRGGAAAAGLLSGLAAAPTG